jgi:lipopolysaccharide/colanic/teichoic acid biosynthesis glycosyltransferase
MLAVLGLVVLGPMILVLGLAVRLDSRGPAFHRARRVCPGGTFILYKLRTMKVTDESDGLGVTVAGDTRITTVGRFLRRTKLDELPQLWNVVRGDMALVGPRPEDPRYVDLTDPLHARVFGALPGITGPTALAFRDEETRLERAARERAVSAGRDEPSAADVEAAYRLDILPVKLASDRDYLEARSVGGDLRIILATLGLGPDAQDGEAPGSR